MNLWLCICLYYLFSVAHADVEEGEPCYTARNEYGICQSIYECTYMLNLLKTRSNNQETRQYLQRSTCKFGAVVFVCCPTENDVISTEPPVTKITGAVLNNEKCGVSNVTNFRVVGGGPAKLHEVPFIVNLGYRNSRDPKKPRWLCGGTLITERHILTAAHCVHNKKDLYIVRLGDLDLNNPNDGTEPEDILLTKAKVHHDYSPVKYTSDIAILTLERAPTNPWVWPVCLPIDDFFRKQTFVKFSAVVAGWGSTYYNGPSSAALQIAQIPVVDTEKCSAAFGTKATIDERTLCAGRADGRQDACQGDSGGPLIWGRFDGEFIRYYLIGVVSYGYRCAEKGYPGVYTRVTTFIDWIEENLN
ncbi:venom protease-like [Diabrotica undecimpunctata]|uniref:venom protease-like n=1 Tax=Diabrotica undecimpunctata TaxID=50387 RepID=UPI003B63543B